MKRLREGFSATATELLCSPPKSLETDDAVLQSNADWLRREQREGSKRRNH